MSTYTNRREEEVVVKEVSTTGVLFDSGWGYGPPEGVAKQLQVGETLTAEMRGTTITGLRRGDTWIYRNSDEKLEMDHLELVAKFKSDREKMLEEKRQDWAEREAALMPELRERLEHFRAVGTNFDVDGWGYELIVCELAQLYLDSDLEETPEIEAYADREGTSGNQHGFAKVLARELRDKGLLPKQIIAALAPLTGSQDYSGMPG